MGNQSSQQKYNLVPNVDSDAVSLPFLTQGHHHQTLKEFRSENDIRRWVERQRFDDQMADGMTQNLLLLYLESKIKPGYLYTSHPCSDLCLDPCDVYQVFKAARFIVCGQLRHDVAVLVTLWIRSSQFHIADGQTGAQVKPSEFKAGQKYITEKCLVAGIQFVGDCSGVQECIRFYNKGRGVVCSNYDPAFLYTLGHEIHEPEYGKPGIGCVKGIHMFKDPESALQYRNTGFIDYHVSSVISAKFVTPRATDDPDMVRYPASTKEKINPHLRGDKEKMKQYLSETMTEATPLPEVQQRFINRLVAFSPSATETKVDPSAIQKSMRMLFGDWYFKHNWNAAQARALAQRHGTLPKEVDASKEVDTPKDANSSKDVDASKDDKSTKEEVNSSHQSSDEVKSYSVAGSSSAPAVEKTIFLPPSGPSASTADLLAQLPSVPPRAPFEIEYDFPSVPEREDETKQVLELV